MRQIQTFGQNCILRSVRRGSELRAGTRMWRFSCDVVVRRPNISGLSDAVVAGRSTQEVASDADDGHGAGGRDHIEAEAEFNVDPAAFMKKVRLEVVGQLLNHQVTQSVDDNADRY